LSWYIEFYAEWGQDVVEEAVRVYKEDPENFDAESYKNEVLQIGGFVVNDVKDFGRLTENANSALVGEFQGIADAHKDLKRRARQDVANFATEHIYIDGVPLKEAFPESQAWFDAHFNPEATTVSDMFAVPQFGQKLQYVPESAEWTYAVEEPEYYDYEQDYDYSQWIVYEPEELSYDEWTVEGDEYYGSLEEFNAPARFEVRFDLSELRAWSESREEVYADLDERFATAAEEYLAARELADQDFARTLEEYFEEGKATDEETLQWAVDYVFDNVSLDGTPLSANGVPTIELAEVKASGSFNYGYLAFGGIAVAGAAVFMANKKKNTSEDFNKVLLV